MPDLASIKKSVHKLLDRLPAEKYSLVCLLQEQLETTNPFISRAQKKKFALRSFKRSLGEVLNQCERNLLLALSMIFLFVQMSIVGTEWLKSQQPLQQKTAKKPQPVKTKANLCHWEEVLNEGNLAYQRNDNKTAEAKLIEAVRLCAIAEPGSRNQAHCYNILGHFYKNIERYDMAVPQYSKALALFEKKAACSHAKQREEIACPPQFGRHASLAETLR